MNCPKCGSEINYVYRTKKLTASVYRERKCCNCGFVFETDELVIREPAEPIKAPLPQARK